MECIRDTTQYYHVAKARYPIAASRLRSAVFLLGLCSDQTQGVRAPSHYLDRWIDLTTLYSFYLIAPHKYVIESDLLPEDIR